jgi:anthranilate synthase component 1
MQIIEELEPTRRGPYAGAVGYFSFGGNMDMCINIRTVVLKGHQAYIQAGAPERASWPIHNRNTSIRKRATRRGP